MSRTPAGPEAEPVPGAGSRSEPAGPPRRLLREPGSGGDSQGPAESGLLHPIPARPPVPSEVTPLTALACWAEARLPGGHQGPPVGTRTGGPILNCDMGPV